jgi:hypothetical protein
MLPPYIRQEIERRLFGNGFRDYEGLAQWAQAQGYNISDDSLWRYGRALQQQFTATQLTVRQACALAERSADYEGSMAQALITVAQQKALASLLEMEQVKPADLNAVANLTRAAIAQQRQAAELKARAEQGGGDGGSGRVAQASLPADTNRAPLKPPQATATAATVTPQYQAGPAAVQDANDQTRLPAEPQTQKMSILSNAKDAVAQASLPAHLIRRGGRQMNANDTAAQASTPDYLIRMGGDDERSIPVEGGSLISLDRAPSAGVQPASHRASPRIAADPCGSPPIYTPPISASASSLARVVDGRTDERIEVHSGHSVKRFLQSAVSGNERTHGSDRQTLTPIAHPCQLVCSSFLPLTEARRDPGAHLNADRRT